MPTAQAGDVVCQGQGTVITYRLLEVWKAAAVQMEIRPAALTDLLEIARRMMLHYPERATSTTAIAGAKWICWAIGNRNRLVLIGPNAFGIAQYGMFYGCEARAQVDILCCRPSAGGALESLRMLRKMVAWARRRGAPSLQLSSDNGTDFAAFGKRLGAIPVTIVKHEIPTR